MSTPLFVKQLKLGPMGNFVYLLGAAGAPEVAVVDPAWDVEAIERAVAGEGKRLACAVVTHCHPDHVNGLPELLGRHHELPVYAQERELDSSPELRELGGGALRPVAPGGSIPVGPLEVVALATPGHTPGSQCLLAEGVLLTGDTLFVNACGRCDLPGGDPEALYRTFTGILRQLPPQTRVFPGHDYGDVPVSSLAREWERNPYFQLPDLASFLGLRTRPRS